MPDCSSLTTPVAAGRSVRFQDGSCFAAAHPSGIVPIARIICGWHQKADAAGAFGRATRFSGFTLGRISAMIDYVPAQSGRPLSSEPK
jgi:hypothetical protein